MTDTEKTRGRGRRWPEGADVGSVAGLFKVNGESPHETVYAQLRHMIIYSQLEPGAWLRQTDLARQFGVSRTPIREALRSLEQEELVELIPNHGARVTGLSMEVFEELYALRMGIEGLAARLAAENATATDVKRLRELLNHLQDSAHVKPLKEYLAEEWQFRLHCYRINRRNRLMRQVKYLREHAERYLRLAYTEEGRVHESLAYHVDLMDAIAAHDGAAAEHINQEALRWTLKRAGPIVAARIDPR